MRVFLTASAADLALLKTGGSLLSAVHAAATDDEMDEFDAMMAAAEPGKAVVAAEVGNAEDPVDLARVAAFHLDVDGTGDLAWYAPDELDQIIELL